MELPNFNIRSGTIFLLVSLGINWPQLTVKDMKAIEDTKRQQPVVNQSTSPRKMIDQCSLLYLPKSR